MCIYRYRKIGNNTYTLRELPFCEEGFKLVKNAHSSQAGVFPLCCTCLFF
jgi:hypothetical protein